MNKVRFGFADTVITPVHPEYVYIDGYGNRSKPADGVRDDLHAKVCAIISGERTFLLFSIDLIGFRKYTYDLITTQISEITGISKENVALCCIHTHAAPATGLLDELPIDTDYFAYVGECCARIAMKAIERACPGSLSFALLPEELTSCYNRRKGREVIDRSIRAATFRDESGALKGVFCTAACHAVVSTDYKLSADWLSVLNRISTDETPYMYFQGRGADIDPKDFHQFPIDEFIERLGGELAKPVKRFAENTQKGESFDGEVRWEYETVRIPMRHFDDPAFLDDGIKKYLDEYLKLPPTDHQKHYKLRPLQWFRHMKRIAESGGDFDLDLPLQYLAIGKTAIFAFVPFELLTLTGNKLEDIFAEAGFPRGGIYVCGYSNITEGYLAPAEEFEFGGYEVAGSNRWYNTGETVPETEGAVLEWFKNKAEGLK